MSMKYITCMCMYKEHIKNIKYKLTNYEFKPVLLPLLQLKSESISMICKRQE